MKKFAFIVLSLGCAFNVWSKDAETCKTKNYPEVSFESLEKASKDKTAYIIDVNSESMFKELSVPGAVHFDAIEKTLVSSLPKDKNAPIVAYCGGPLCTAWKKAAIRACEAGYTNISHFKGGITVWKKRSAAKS